MRIQYCSDLHLEFPENAAYLNSNPLKKSGDILIIAGDLVPFQQLDNHIEQIRQICEPYEHVYWLPGNHEYYYDNIEPRTGVIKEKILPNLTLVNNQSITFQHTELIFSTLWTHISPAKSVKIKNSLTDFALIKNGTEIINIEKYNQLHHTSVEFIRHALKNSQDKEQVVITHHCPTFINYPLAYANSPINEAFAVELGSFIGDFKPRYWIYGHTHINTPSFSIGQTQLITNQLGYIRRNQHHEFNSQLFIEL